MTRVRDPELRQRILEEAVGMVRTLGVSQLTMCALAEPELSHPDPGDALEAGGRCYWISRWPTPSSAA